MQVFKVRGVPEGKPLRAEERTNKPNPHMTSSVEIEPELHCWEASALPTAPPLLFTAQLDCTSKIHSYFVQALGILLAMSNANWLHYYFENSNAEPKLEGKTRVGKLQQHTSFHR